MRRTIQALLIAVIPLACDNGEQPVDALSCPANGHQQHPRQTAYKQILDRYMAETRSPGCLMLVAREGEPVWAAGGGLAALSENRALCVDFPFRIGSLTKVFTATIVLQLVQERKVALEEPMKQHLPETWQRHKLDEGITVRSLLAHTSGLVDPPNQSIRYKTDLVNNPEKMRSMSGDDWLEKYVKGKKLLFRHGEGFSYSNAGYMLLGMLIEKIEKKPFAVSLQERISTPLGLPLTYLTDGRANLPVKGYAASTGQQIRDVTIWDDAEGSNRAYGGLISTLSDLHKFYIALVDGNLISAELLSQMKQRQLPTCSSDECQYGLGLEIWRVNEHTGYGHNGSLAGLEANALYFPETKTCVILFKNLGGGSDKSFLGSLIE